MLGLVLVAIGTGGIKACVSAFVGDQFVKGQESLLGMMQRHNRHSD
jgi:dipeptide/tripeptide permease